MRVRVYPRGGDGPVALQAGRVPDLGLDGVGVQLNRPCAELHPDGGAAVQGELVLGESRQQVGLAHARLSDQHHWRGGGEPESFQFYVQGKY